MAPTTPQLLEPWTCRGLTIPNRCVLAPMCTTMAEPGTNTPNHRHLVHYGALSMGGYGLVIIEATAVEYAGSIWKTDLGIHTQEHIEKHKEINDFIHDNSQSKTCLQVAHAGRKGMMSEFSADSYQLTPEDEYGARIVSASALAAGGDALIAGGGHNIVPHPLTTVEVEEMVQKFAKAAYRGVLAGYDAIEIQAAHGFLINQFLSTLSNQRQDKYGGSHENRMRFLMEIVKAIRKVIPMSMPLSVRLSAVDWVPEGVTIEETITLCKALDKVGVDIIHVSSGGMSPNQKIPSDEDYQISLAAEIKKHIQAKVIAVGLIRTIEKAEEVLANGSADMVAIARAALKDPYWLRNEMARQQQTAWHPKYQAMGYSSVRKQARKAAEEEEEAQSH